MPRCSASSCRNMGSHTFPKDPYLRELWEEATNKENFKASKHSRLCSDHFQPSDYVDVSSSTGMSPFHKYLKKTAVPSIFSGKIQQSNGASGTETRTTSTPKKNNVLKKVAGSPQNTPKEQESNSCQINNSPRNKSVRLRNRKAYLLNRRCSVPHCNTRPTNEISLYPCPNNAAVRNEWAEALRVSYQYVKNMVACSLHFTKLDFIQSKNSERVLKHNAVPSRNLQTRKKVMVPVKHKLLKKGASNAFDRQRTMTDTVSQTKEAAKEEVIRECRACLKKLDDKKSCCNVFQAWAPPWEGMEATIAEDLAKLANIEISLTDRHSKVLCAPCYQRLLDAATFAANVRTCDLLLRMRFTADIDMEKVWPKPIQVDKNINGAVFNNSMDIEIKQEVLTDDEYSVKRTDNPYVETELANLDIKIEPEELVEPPPLNIVINGTISLDPLNSENKHKNVPELHKETQYLQMEVKQEPTSDGEQEIDLTPDLPLECLLCTKSFNSVTGLKAHVIAQHSYKTVKRKADGSVSPEKKRCDQHQCAICKRNFQTSTDLMVHETCHNKHVCYGCTEKFDSFELLTRHRKRCKASIANSSVQKLKTLEDVKRPLPEEKVEYLEMEIEKLEPETKYKHDEDIDMTELEPINKDVEMKELNSEQKEENSQENQVECVIENVENDNKIESDNALDSVVIKEVYSDKKLVCVIEAVEKEKQLESIKQEEESVIQEEDSDKKPECIIEEIDNDKKSESIIEELDNDENTEKVTEDLDNDKKTQSVIEELENDKKSESVFEDLDNDKKIQIQSVIEDLDNDKKIQIQSVIEDLDNDKKIQIQSVNEDLDIDKKLESVINDLDNDKKSESVIEESGNDQNSESVVEELNNDKKLKSIIEELEIGKKSESVIEELDNDKKTLSFIEDLDSDKKSENIIEDVESVNKKVEIEKEVETAE